MAVTKKQLANLKPPKKGEVRNPKGRGKGTLNFKTRAKWLLDAEEQITHPVTGKKIMLSVTDQIDLALIKKARAGDLTAIREVFDRLEGRAVSPQEGNTFNFNFMNNVRDEYK